MDLGREGKGRPKPQPKLKGIIGSVLRRRIKQCEQELQPNVVKLLTQAPVLFEHPHSGDPAAPAAFGADLREPNECGPRTTGFGRTGSHAAHAALAVRGADGKIRRAHSADRDVTCSECSTLFPPRGWSAPGLQAAGHVGDIMAWRSMSAAFEAPAASYALSMSHTMCAGATLGEGHSNDQMAKAKEEKANRPQNRVMHTGTPPTRTPPTGAHDSSNPGHTSPARPTRRT